MIRGGARTVIDFDKLRQNLSHDIVEGREERYQFTWPDKKKASHLANLPITATLRPCREESVDFDNTKNLYIEGDNLDVLKCLKETYFGKVKMIYIDPPYNTGNDFVYKDDFSQSSEEYLPNSGQFDNQGNRLVQNTESNGRFHTYWLNMMFPRLKLARNLLTDDGVIFISIDDNELVNLEKICSEVFGLNNRVGLMTIMSNPRGSQNGKHLSHVHEYILMYAKDSNSLDIKGISKGEAALSEYSEQDENGRKYRLLGLRKRGGAWKKEDRPKMHYPIFVNPADGKCSLVESDLYTMKVIPQRPTGELSRWTWGQEKFALEKDCVVGKKVNRNGVDVWDIYRKDYIDDENGEEKTTKIKTIWDEKDTNYQNAKNEIKALFGNSEIFDYPKPTYIVKKLASMLYMEQDDIVLDFFSGSSSTAQAVFQLNADDGVTRKFIMVQLPAPITEKSVAYKAGYKNICEIGKERIRLAGPKIKEEAGLQGQNLDIGLRVLKLDSSNMQDVYYAPSDMKQDDLFANADNVKPGRTAEDLLFQVMLQLGATLDSKIEKTVIDGKEVFNVAEGYLVACFDTDVTETVVTSIAKIHPTYAVLRDSGLANDSVATNFEQIFKTYSPTTMAKVI